MILSKSPLPGLDPRLSGLANPVATTCSTATTDTPWPDLIRPPTSDLTPKTPGTKTWMTGSSPVKGIFGVGRPGKNVGIRARKSKPDSRGLDPDIHVFAGASLAAKEDVGGRVQPGQGASMGCYMNSQHHPF